MNMTFQALDCLNAVHERVFSLQEKKCKKCEVFLPEHEKPSPVYPVAHSHL